MASIVQLTEWYWWIHSNRSPGELKSHIGPFLLALIWQRICDGNVDCMAVNFAIQCEKNPVRAPMLHRQTSFPVPSSIVLGTIIPSQIIYQLLTAFEL